MLLTIANLQNKPNILKIANIEDVVKLSRPREQYHQYIATLSAISSNKLVVHFSV